MASKEEGNCSLKRKPAAGEREALDMFPSAKEAAPAIIPHWAGPISTPAAAATGSRKLLQERAAVAEPMAAELFPEDAELRRRVKQTLLTFPESKALSADQLEEAIDRVVRESRPETASVPAPGMVRLGDDDIRIWLFLLATPTVDDVLGADAAGVFPPRWIEERKAYLDEQCQAKNKRPGQSLLLVHKIRVDLIARGFVEVQKEYVQSDSEDEDEDSDEEEAAACPYDTYGPDDEVQGGLVLLI